MKILTNSLRASKDLVAAIVYRYNAMLSEPGKGPIRPFLIALLLKVPETETFIASEFVSAGGLNFIAKNGGLGLTWENELGLETISDHLSIITQICIASKDFYPSVSTLNILPHLKVLLKSAPEPLREKTARLLGQMCKHSDFFYADLDYNNLIPELATACRSNSVGLRRSACLALGNAAFHSVKLYHSLENALPAIILLLIDPDDRTRANAVGTLNNLVRNGDTLHASLIKLGVLEKFHTLAVSENSPIARNLVFFALGNYCKDENFLKKLRDLFTVDDRRKIAHELENGAGEELVLYASRFLAKLES